MCGRLSLKTLFVSVAFLLLISSIAFASWQSDLEKLLKTSDPAEQDTLIAKIVAANPPWQEVAEKIEGMQFPEARDKGKCILRTALCSDGVERPWVLYVPESYDPKKPTPLFVILHGGVSSINLEEDPLGYAKDDPFRLMAEKEGWLSIHPFGQIGATWWDQVGMANIDNLIRTVKQEYNVDDDRVWVGGFSDGASAGFLYAMIKPNDFGAFLALNGHMGVGSIDGGLSTYATNFFNTPVYAVTTDNDPLYPSKMMRPMIELAQSAEGNLFYRELSGRHDFLYADTELPLVARFFNSHPRDPFPVEIRWETAGAEFGACRWLAIDEVKEEAPAEWHQDYNLTLLDEGIVIGFTNDDSHKSPGVKVGVVFEETPAWDMGLQVGDVIVAAGEMTVSSMDDIFAYKETIKRGDDIQLEIMRDEQKMALFGTIPPPEEYQLFNHQLLSGEAIAHFSGNQIEVQTSRVGVFHILVHPDMVRPDQNLVIVVNGKEVYNQPVEPNLEFMLRNFLENRDRRLLYIAQVNVEL